MEDDIDNSLQLQHRQNIDLKCLSNNLDDVAKEVHIVWTKFEDHLIYMFATEHEVTGIEKDIDKI